jgi:branched-chain amino acid transport system ATP-binding protein
MCRSFQNIRLFKSMTALENVKVGFHGRLATNLLDAVLRGGRYRRDERYAEEKGMELLRVMRLERYAGMKAANLAYGTQRRLEIARALATDPELLLLDEPAAGMNPAETADLTGCIGDLNRGGRTIVVIEHDMKLIMRLCHVITVLNHGAKICEGDAGTVRNDPEVIRAYLGRSAAE